MSLVRYSKKIKPMKTRLPILMMIFLLTKTSVAQENQDQSTFDQDLGFNAVFIFQGLFQSQQAPFSVMYKKYKSPDKALRFGADLSFNSNSNSGNANGGYSDSSYGNVYVIVGVEKQQAIGGDWTWYYGFDAVPRFSYDRYESYSNNIKVNSSQNSTVGLGAKPFVGIRFNVTQRLYVSAEASAQLSYAITTTLQKNYNPEQTVRDTSNKMVSFGINPASGIFLFYRF
jgi:hypothetical protein